MSRFDYVQALYGIGTCHACRREYTLTKAGNVRAHNDGVRGIGDPRPRRCPGSRTPPWQPTRVETIDTRGLT